MPTATAPAAPSSGTPPRRHRLGRATLALVVVATAAAALLIHHHAAKPDVRAWTGVQMNGTTSQRLPIFAVERKGALRAVYMNWRAECPRGGAITEGWHFREPVNAFHRTGRSFEVHQAVALRDGATVRASVRGHLNADLRTAQGVASWGVFDRAGHSVGWACAAPPVTWRVELAAGLVPN